MCVSILLVAFLFLGTSVEGNFFFNQITSIQTCSFPFLFSFIPIEKGGKEEWGRRG